MLSRIARAPMRLTSKYPGRQFARRLQLPRVLQTVAQPGWRPQTLQAIARRPWRPPALPLLARRPVEPGYPDGARPAVWAYGLPGLGARPGYPPQAAPDALNRQAPGLPPSPRHSTSEEPGIAPRSPAEPGSRPPFPGNPAPPARAIQASRPMAPAAPAGHPAQTEAGPPAPQPATPRLPTRLDLPEPDGAPPATPAERPEEPAQRRPLAPHAPLVMRAPLAQVGQPIARRQVESAHRERQPIAGLPGSGPSSRLAPRQPFRPLARAAASPPPAGAPRQEGEAGNPSARAGDAAAKPMHLELPGQPAPLPPGPQAAGMSLFVNVMSSTSQPLQRAALLRLPWPVSKAAPSERAADRPWSQRAEGTPRTPAPGQPLEAPEAERWHPVVSRAAQSSPLQLRRAAPAPRPELPLPGPATPASPSPDRQAPATEGKVEPLPAAAVQRAPAEEGITEATPVAGPTSQPIAEGEAPAIDLDALACQVYDILRRRLRVEQERARGRSA